MTKYLLFLAVPLVVMSLLPGGRCQTDSRGFQINEITSTVDPIYLRIDPRYEDDMVDPPLVCTMRGFFAHPRNCSRFYVCDSSDLSPDHYRKDFFNCAAGTQFVQVTENEGFCNFTNGSLPPCNQEPLPTIFTTDSTTRTSTITSTTTTPTTTTPTTTTPTTTTTTPVPVCSEDNCVVTFSECETHTICPGGGLVEMSESFCKKATYSCPHCILAEASYCGDGLWYIDNTNAPARLTGDQECFTNPNAADVQCCNDCYISTSRCQPKNVCIDGVFSEHTLCPNADEVCDPCGRSKKVCAEGLQFSMATGHCIDPDLIDIPCSQTRLSSFSPPTLRVAASKLKKMDVVRCSGNEITVKSQKLQEKYCHSYPFCSGRNNFMGTYDLCSNYYQCNYQVLHQTWRAKKMQCPPGMLFSYDNDICIATKNSVCPGYVRNEGI